MLIRNAVFVAMGYLRLSEPSSVLHRERERALSTTEEIPKFSILIPTRDKAELLRECVNSIHSNSIGVEFELIIIDNGSTETATLNYLDQLSDEGVKIFRLNEKFNYSRLMNFAASKASFENLVFLNNDTVVTSPGWLRDFHSYLRDPEIGVVGATLWSQANTIMHCGVALGTWGLATHPFAGKSLGFLKGIFGDQKNQVVSAVTFACAATTASSFKTLGGLDERFPVGLNDVDFCLRASRRGLLNLVTFESNLIHHEGSSRKHPRKSPLGILQSLRAIALFLVLHKTGFMKDAYFSTRQL